MQSQNQKALRNDLFETKIHVPLMPSITNFKKPFQNAVTESNTSSLKEKIYLRPKKPPIYPYQYSTPEEKKVCLDMNPNAKTPGKSVNLLLTICLH